jgi:hypothetical protein
MDNDSASEPIQKIIISDNLIQFYDLLIKVDRRLREQKNEVDSS